MSDVTSPRGDKVQHNNSITSRKRLAILARTVFMNNIVNYIDRQSKVMMNLGHIAYTTY